MGNFERTIRLVHALALSGMSADEVVAMVVPDENGNVGVRHLTPEEKEWLLQQETEQDLVAAYDDVREHPGPELGEIIRELESEGSSTNP